MTNGTRIDPEEREPRAIKIRNKNKKGKKIVFAVLSAILIVAIGGGIFAFIEYGPFDFGTSAVIETEPKNEETYEPEITEEPEEQEEIVEPEEKPIPEVPVVEEPIIEEDLIPRNEWFMLLVNYTNILPEDFSVETVVIDSENHTVDARIVEDLLAMIAAGESEGLDFVIYTGYRSVAKQKELFEAGKTGAAPGTSEHNTGLAVDIGCAKGEFVGSPEEAWLLEHAHEYGFILRYPEDKAGITGFTHEPWHFRYVGKEQASIIRESGLCLEEYLAQ